MASKLNVPALAAWAVVILINSLFAAGAWQGRIPLLGYLVMTAGQIAAYILGRLDDR